MTSNKPQSQNDEPQIDFDLDALQAQINMAMAETEELVSSWVRPSKANNASTTSGDYSKPKRTFEEMERELKDYLRRPPRLGVGAPMPESAGPTAQEELKLKNRLVGNNNKKRSRDAASSALSGKELEVNEDDDEEELKAKKGESGPGTKRVRIDPFSLPKKKVKRVDGGDGVSSKSGRDLVDHVPVIDGMPRATPEQNTLTKIEAKSTVPLNSQIAQFGNASPTSPTSISSPSPTSPTSLKKKKKKKHKLTSPHIDVIPNGVLSSATINGVASSHNTGAIPGRMSSASTTNDGGPVSNASPVQQTSNANRTSPTASATSPTSPTSPSSTTSTKKRKKKKKKHALTQPHGSSTLNGVPAAPRMPSGVTSSAPTDDKSLTIGTPIANGMTVEEARAEAEEWTGFGDATSNPVEDQEAGIPSSPKPKANGIPTSEPHSPTTHKVQAHAGLSLSLPLLNLNGPPFSITNDNNNEDEAIRSPKTKKRRRRRKKSKVNGTGVENAGQVP